MKLSRWLSISLLAATLLMTPDAALADVKAYNAAVKAGDYKTAAVEAKAVWASWDKTDQDTAVMAREFGFANFVAGDYAAAKSFGEFLRDEGARLPIPDDQPATSRVLLAAATFRLKADDASHDALLQALKAREALQDIDNMSVLASESLYKADWAAGGWSKASESAALSWRLLERTGPGGAVRALDARGTSAAAGFLSHPDKGDYDKIVDAHNAVVEQINAATDPRLRMSFVPLKFQLEAWSYSVGSYFQSHQQTGSNIPIRVKERELAKPEAGLFPGGVQTGDQCGQSEVVWPELNYPSAALFKGVVGTVIMKVDTDASGKAVKWETLAAVPARYFATEAEKAMPRLKIKRAAGEPSDCSLAYTSRVLTLMFLIK